MFNTQRKKILREMLLSYKAGHCLFDREPGYCYTPSQPGFFLLQKLQVYRTLPFALTGSTAKICETYFLGLKTRN